MSRTLCPLDANQIQPLQRAQTFYVEISTQSNVSVPFSLRAEIVEDFMIQ